MFEHFSHTERLPGEIFLINCLQKNIGLSINNRNVKRGKLLLFRRNHYYIQLTLATEKGTNEHLDIPVPFRVEDHLDEGLLYFDYRMESLGVEVLPKIPDKVSSIYFNNILEIFIINNYSLKNYSLEK
jgi:hypothetical protein